MLRPKVTKYYETPELSPLAIQFSMELLEAEKAVVSTQEAIEACYSEETKSLLAQEEVLSAQLKALRKEIDEKKKVEVPAVLKETLALAESKQENARIELGLVLAEMMERNPELSPTQINLGLVTGFNDNPYELVVNETRFGGWEISDPLSFMLSIGKERMDLFEVTVKLKKDKVKEANFNEWARFEVNNGTLKGVSRKYQITARIEGKYFTFRTPEEKPAELPSSTPSFSSVFPAVHKITMQDVELIEDGIRKAIRTSVPEAVTLSSKHIFICEPTTNLGSFTWIPENHQLANVEVFHQLLKTNYNLALLKKSADEGTLDEIPF